MKYHVETLGNENQTAKTKRVAKEKEAKPAIQAAGFLFGFCARFPSAIKACPHVREGHEDRLKGTLNKWKPSCYMSAMPKPLRRWRPFA
jgi:hypothetical protein